MRVVSCWIVLFVLGVVFQSQAFADNEQTKVTVFIKQIPPLIELNLFEPANPARERAKPPLNRRWLSQIQSEPLGQGTSQPPLEWGLILFQGFSGAIVTTVSSLLFQSIIDILLINNQTSTKPTEESVKTAIYIRSALVFAMIPWLAALTVYGIGRLSNSHQGNYWWALLGGYAGQLAALGLNLLFTSLDSSTDKNGTRIASFILDGLLTSIGTVLLYTLFRTSQKGVQYIGALMHLEKGKWHWGVPLPTLVQSEHKFSVVAPIVAGRF